MKIFNRKKEEKQKKEMLITVVALFIIVLILFFILAPKGTNYKDQPISIDGLEVYDLGSDTPEGFGYQSLLFKTFEEYQTYISQFSKKPTLKESDFEKYDYILDFASYGECTDNKIKEVTKIEILASTINVYFNVDNKCGDCELRNVGYFIRVDNNKFDELPPIDHVETKLNPQVVCEG